MAKSIKLTPYQTEVLADELDELARKEHKKIEAGRLPKYDESIALEKYNSYSELRDRLWDSVVGSTITIKVVR